MIEATQEMISARSISDKEKECFKPVYVVWEITTLCDHSCSHCGTRAGSARKNELTTEEMFSIAHQLIALGTREVTLIGGEVYLRNDTFDLIKLLADSDIRVAIQTGGLGLTTERIESFWQAGLAAIGVSIDGLEQSHDILRNRRGSWKAGMLGIERCVDVGIPVTVNSQVNRLNMCELSLMADSLKEVGVYDWRPHLTVPLGRAADRPEWILQPWHVVDIIDELARIKSESLEEAQRKGLAPLKSFKVMLGNNLGYFGPHEALLRSYPGQKISVWSGCSAGKFVLGIESDGKIKGCPSLPTKSYTGGNIRDLSIEDIWNDQEELKFSRNFASDNLWGFCSTCYYADVCKAGCNFTAHATLGKRGNMPFCYHRATTLRSQNKRERLVPVERAPGEPYDHGRFELVEESIQEL